jgi:hypothetical protein
MDYEGTIKGGVVVFATEPALPEGTRVSVRPLASVVSSTDQTPQEPLGKRLMKFAGRARGLPRDAARNHDHYLYGTPKR